MSSTNRRVHRVMVALTDVTRKGLMTTNEENRQEDELKILDNSSLLLRIQSNKGKKVLNRTILGADGEGKGNLGGSPRYYRHLQFDSIGYEYEPHVRRESTDLIEQMFRQHRHGCLLRLTPLRTHNLNFLTRLLVAEVDKMMLVQHARLKTINIDYFDVRKFDMVNMLSESSARDSVASKTRSRQINQRGRSLQSTRELFQWLLTEYSLLRTRVTGDDFIDLQYVFRDDQQKLYKLHLNIFQIYGCVDRLDISGFFSSLPLGRKSHGTLLTDCIKESFDFNRPMRTLILFELPLSTGKDSPKWVSKILKLADIAYTSIKNSYRNCEDDMPCQRSEKKDHILAASSKTNLSGSISFSSSSSKSSQSYSLSLRHRAVKLSNDDYNSLAYWYGRIDSKFRELQLSLEEHYKLLYREKSLQICSSLTSMTDDVSNINDQQCGGDTIERLKNLQKFSSTIRHPTGTSPEMPTSQYLDLLKQFRQLENEATKSCFASTLMVYMSTKNYELSEAAKAVKQREVENLRRTLIKYINSEGGSNQCA